MNSTISYWNLTGNKTHYPRLDKSISADVLIIGGGIVGVTCAYCLAEKGIMPVLIEAGALADGTSGNTTGKLTVQHDVIYYKIAEKYGLKAAQDYFSSQAGALDFVKNAAEKEKIECQLTSNNACIFAVNNEELDTLEREYKTAKKIGIDAQLRINPDFPPGSKGLLSYSGQYVFHPVRYIDGLAKAAADKGAVIYCDTKAVKLEDGELKKIRCEGGITVTAKHVVMATQYPFYDGANLFFTRLYPKRAYGIAVRAKREWPEDSYINVGDPARSIRTHIEKGERILITVGESHDTGRGYGDMAKHFDNLLKFADQTAGAADVIAGWSAQDYDTPDELPYIGRISDNSNIYAATGFRKWGLLSGTLSGMLITDLIINGNCRYEGLYSRTRSDITSSFKKAFVGTVNPVIELVKSKLEGTRGIEGLQPGEGRVIRFGGEKAGVYRDDNDNVTVIDITCTHMGTELNFNSAEKTWDCPAHGGRYNTDGKLLEGPPKDSLKVLFKGTYKDFLDKY
ncbi:MAG: FAD-dependent oxidoreductase [Clostridiales bacterium]|nr:FAD-dependent oxidoreductase [Clostridiales bacterium]